MIKRVDRIQIATSDRNSAEQSAAGVFGAELIRRDEVGPLHAKRSTMQAGTTLIELLEPDGAGPVQDFVSKWESGLYGAGFSVADLNVAASDLQKRNVRFTRSDGQIFLDPTATFGMNAVLSAHHERSTVG